MADSPANAKPRRGWFTISLRTPFVVVTVLGCGLGWAGYQLHWIRERHRVVLGLAYDDDKALACPAVRGTAPWSLRIVGEQGYTVLYTPHIPSDPIVARLRCLFPEAGIDAAGRFVKPGDPPAPPADSP